MQKSFLTNICSLSLVLLIQSNLFALDASNPVSYPDSPFYASIVDAFANQQHYLNILNIGDEALLARIHLIRQAQTNIDIQTFIWDVDETSRYLAYELIQAAKRGVKVKIIVDAFTLPAEPQLFAFIAQAHPNLELRIYNPATDKMNPSGLNILMARGKSFRDINQRMHNKIFVVDDHVGITGGRNYENDYYDRGIKRTFKDREALIVGPVVKQMKESFLEYWNHELVLPIQHMRDVALLIDNKQYESYQSKKDFHLNGLFDDIEKCASNYSCMKEKLIDTQYKVSKIEFFADKPGKDEKLGNRKTSKTTYELGQFINSARESIVMQTPYLVVGKKGTKFFKDIAKEKPGVQVLVSSNSLAAADHAHAYAFSYKNKKKYLKSFRWQIFEFKPIPQDINKMIAFAPSLTRDEDFYVCIHAKTYVVDSARAWVGSFNLDPRSGYLNTEVGVIIHDAQVAKDIEKDILRDMSDRNSWTIGRRKKVPILGLFSGALDDVIKITGIDIWPFQYTESFKLKEGGTTVPFYDKNFYKNYKSVGPFPGSRLTTKEIESRLIKAFLGPMEPLI